MSSYALGLHRNVLASRRALSAAVPAWAQLQLCDSSQIGNYRSMRKYAIQAATDVYRVLDADLERGADSRTSARAADAPKEKAKPLGRPGARAALRNNVKQHSRERSPPDFLVRPAKRYRTGLQTRRSLGRHINDVRKQTLHAMKSATYGMLSQNDWRDTLSLMIHHTPNFDQVFHFKVLIGKAVALEAKSLLLSGLDTNIWQISKRYQSAIHVEEGDGTEGLVLSLSGSQWAVRQSLLEMLRTVDKLTALRVENSDFRVVLAEDWAKSPDRTKERVRVVRLAEEPSQDMALTLLDDTTRAAFTAYRPYILRQPASDIAVPTIWTKESFEKYVAALTYSEVPSHKSRELYGTSTDHQQVVALLLVEAFTSEEPRQAISMSALKMALAYLQKKGPGFKVASEEIFSQIDLRDLPVDVETFTILLVGASRNRDLASFTKILKTMIRKGFKLHAGAWVAFVEMFYEPEIKFNILEAMRRKGLYHTRSNSIEMARQLIVTDLETRVEEEHGSHIKTEAGQFPMEEFLREQDEKYESPWLNTVAMNKMLEILGRNDQIEACRYLLGFAQRHGRALPDTVTINTMLTHVRTIREKIDIMETTLGRHPWLKPDQVTYKILFRIAWRFHNPNMMSVVWRYSVATQCPAAKVKAKLSSLFRQDDVDTVASKKRRAYMPITFGHQNLEEATSRARSKGEEVSFTHVLTAFTERVEGQMPTAKLWDKLGEAYRMDTRLHKIARDEGEIPASRLADFEVDIPMSRRRTSGLA